MAVGILLPFVCVSKVKTDLMLFPDAHKIKGNDTDLFWFNKLNFNVQQLFKTFDISTIWFIYLA